MIDNIFIFLVALFLVVKGATMATKYAGRLAESFHLSKYTVGFIIIAIISILPETFISINSAIAGIPSFGLGMLFGSNIADLTLIFAILVLYAGRSLKVENKILKNNAVYPFILLVPLIVGFNGSLSRLEGLALIAAGGIFYYMAFKNGSEDVPMPKQEGSRKKNMIMLLVSMTALLVGSHLTVTSATAIANNLGVNPILIGMLIVGLGTTMPELFFSLRSIRKNDDSLAIGDMLGTVMADALIVVGILALIDPFVFPQKIIYITGAFMVVASFVLFRFMRSGHSLTKKEAWMLFAFWIVFVLVEFFANY